MGRTLPILLIYGVGRPGLAASKKRMWLLTREKIKRILSL